MPTPRPAHLLVMSLLVGVRLTLFLPCARAAAGETRVAVIVARSSDMQTMSPHLLRDIYLKKIFVDRHGHRIVPVNLPPEHPLRRAFSGAVIHMDEARLQTYWNRQYFQGINPPYVLDSQQAIAEFVARTHGAIGYVQPCALTPSVRVLMLMTVHGKGVQHCGLPDTARPPGTVRPQAHRSGPCGTFEGRQGPPRRGIRACTARR